MSNPFCINPNNEEYREMVSIFGEDLTYYLWNENGGQPLDHAPNGEYSNLFNDLFALSGNREDALELKAQIYTEDFKTMFDGERDENGEPVASSLFVTEEDEDEITKNRKHPKVKEALENPKYKPGEINDFNNPLSWDIEKEFDLLEKEKNDKGELVDKWTTLLGRRIKHYRKYRRDRAERIASEIRAKGHLADIRKTYRGNTVKYYVVPGVPIGIKGDRYKYMTVAGREIQTKEEDAPHIRRLLGFVNRPKTNVISLLKTFRSEYGEVLENNPLLKAKFDFIIRQEEKLKTLRVYNLPEHDSPNAYAVYDPTFHLIGFNVENLIEEPSLEAFAEILVHEAYHGMTAKAIDDPTSEAERKFKAEIEKIFETFLETNKDNTDYIEMYQSAWTKENKKTGEVVNDVHEFISAFNSNSDFAASLKPTIIKRIRHAVYNFFVDLLNAVGVDISKKGDFTYDKVDRVVNSFIENQTKFMPVSPTTYSKRDDNAKKYVAARDSIKEKIRHILEGRPKEIAKALRSIANDFIFDKKEHTYYHKPTGTWFTSTTEFLASVGIGGVRVFEIKEGKEYVIAKGEITYNKVLYKKGQTFVGIKNKSSFKGEGEVISVAVERGGNLGNAMHRSVESIVEDVAYDIEEETGFKVGEQAIKSLIKIIEDLKGESGIALSEVLVAHPEKSRAGTIDLIIIDKTGRVHLFDFKTKEKGFRWYNSTKYGVSDKKKYHMQLNFYKHMLDKMFPFKLVASMNVVMLQPDVVGDEIVDVELDNTIFDSGIDRFETMESDFAGTYGDKPVRYSASALIDRVKEDIRADSYMDLPEFLLLASEKSKLTEAETLLKETLNKFNKRLDIMQARYSFSKREGFEKFMDELVTSQNATSAFLQIVTYAYKQTNIVKKQYDDLIKKGERPTAETLYQWKDYLVVFEVLDDIKNLVMDDPSMFSDPKTMDMLNSAIDVKNFIKHKFLTIGKEIIAEWLAPYYNGIRAEIREKILRKYRVDLTNKTRKFRKEGNSKKEARIKAREELGTEEEYVQEQLTLKGTDIAKKTYELLYKELTLASRDVSELTRWLDNMLDASDPVVSAAVNAFMEKDDLHEVEALNKRAELIDDLTEFEKTNPKGLLTSEEELYSFILERDEDGELTQYLLKPWTSAFEQIEKKHAAELFKDYDSAQAKKNLAEWRKEFMPTDKEAYYDGLEAHLNLFVVGEEKLIRNNEVDIIITNLVQEEYRDLHEMAEEGEISEFAADQALEWMKLNRWKYSQFKDYTDPKTKKVTKAINPKWSEFVKELGISTELPIYEQMAEVEKSTHPKAKLYNVLMKLAKEADSMVPYSYRLGYRLPGVAKTSHERVRSGQSPATFFKEEFKSSLFLRPEDIERGESMQFKDELGRAKYFIPIHYTAQIEPKNQSYDLPGIFYKRWSSANEYSHKRQILSEMEMTKFFVETRDVKKRSVLNKIIPRKINKGEDDDDQPERMSGSNLAAMFSDWFELAVYGRKTKDTNKGTPSGLIKINENWVLDTSKAVDALNRYTSLNLLGGNLVQGVANVLIGETMQAIDTFAGEHVNMKSFTKANLIYHSWLPKMMLDSGLKQPQHKGSLIIERFGILHGDPRYTNFAMRTRVGQQLNYGSLYFIQQAGEHWMQARFLFALLLDKKAYDKEGNEIGSMLEQYQVKNGKLIINPKVDLIKSKWTAKDQAAFKQRAKGLLSRMHGEYSELGRVAIQRLALGRMAYMFRKFVIPGIKRRYGRRKYIQRLDQFVEGNYITTAKFVANLFQDLKIFKLALMSEEWAKLNDHERANIYRTIAEVAFVIGTTILANVFFRLKEDDDDDDRFNAFLAYQFFRLQTELLFFSPKLDEAITILRSPMASMSVVENIIKMLGQIFHPFDEYERGPWKGEYKIKKTMINFVPLYKQYYKARDVEEQIPWFKN